MSGIMFFRRVLLLCLLLPGSIWAQSLELQLETRDKIYAELPFNLRLTASGFDEEPAPAAPALDIEGCRVTFLGMTPNVAERIQIVNGQRSEWRQVTFVYRWRVEAAAPGTFTVPAMSITQGDKQATSLSGSFRAERIATTDDMIVRMDLPERTIWLGETFDAAVEWLLRRDVKNHEFVVPLFDLEHVRVESPTKQRGRTLPFRAGAQDIDLPIVRDSVDRDGTRYSRFRFPARVTITRPGTLELAPVRVAAALKTGAGRDTFGFPRDVHELFKAEGEPRRLVVRPLPQENRPSSFVNAIGSGFSIGVRASRSVVQVGDPIDLQIRVRGDGPLEGLSLPPLDGEGGLPTEKFSVPDAATVGVIDEDTNAKVFDVTVRIRSADAREIPPLAFSYFDPAKGEYATVYSEPIALSVAGSNLIGADDVTVAPKAPSAAAPDDSSTSQQAATNSNKLGSLVGADMSLSAPDATLRRTWSVSDVVPVLLLLYLVPPIIVLLKVWSATTRHRRDRQRTLRGALRDVEHALTSSIPAREAAPQVVKAMRALARATDRERELREPLLEQLETQAFDPSAGDQPLDEELVQRVRALAQEWGREEGGLVRAGATAVMIVTLVGIWTSGVNAVTADGSELVHARELYQAALQEQERARRTGLFTQAEQTYRELASTRPDAPELVTDWGNAALGAQDIGHAVLAYRRALLAAPSHERAANNLVWLRERAPTWLPRPAVGGPLDSLLFWHGSLSVAERHLIGAVAFAVGLLLLAPWSAARTPMLRRLAIPALAIWIAATGSAMLDSRDAKAAVVITDGAVLRSADSLGAQPAFANPLPAGAELQILETRDAWFRVALADGTRGWVAASAIAKVEL